MSCLRRLLPILALFVGLTLAVPAAPARATLALGTLKPNDLFMPYLGGMVVFSLFDHANPSYPVRGWFIDQGATGLADRDGNAIALNNTGGFTFGPDGNLYL